MLNNSQTSRKLVTLAAFVALSGVAFAGWTRTAPASAQDQPPPPARPGGMRGFGGGGGALAASGDYVYVLRGPTLYQFKAADLSLASQKTLPQPPPPPAPAGQ